MEFKRVLVTGGCGFLGQYLIKDLLKGFPGIKIRVIDLKQNPNPIFDISKNQDVEVILGKDICDIDSISPAFSDVGAVIHLAGLVSFSLKDKDLLKRVNVIGTKNVARLSKENKVGLFIHISSVAALGYKDDETAFVDESFRFDWRIAESMKKYYMLTKHLADVEVERYRKKGLDAIIVYPGLMYGPGDLANSSRMISAIQKRKIPVNMPGGTNVIDVRDVSKGIIAALSKGISGDDYLLSGKNLTFRYMNKEIARQLKVKNPRLTLPKFLNRPMFNILLLAESVAKKRLQLTADNIDSAFKFRYFDNSKASKELGWKPEFSFEMTIKDTINWMKKNGMLER